MGPCGNPEPHVPVRRWRLTSLHLPRTSRRSPWRPASTRSKWPAAAAVWTVWSEAFTFTIRGTADHHRVLQLHTGRGTGYRQLRAHRSERHGLARKERLGPLDHWRSSCTWNWIAALQLIDGDVGPGFGYFSLRDRARAHHRAGVAGGEWTPGAHYTFTPRIARGGDSALRGSMPAPAIEFRELRWQGPEIQRGADDAGRARAIALAGRVGGRAEGPIVDDKSPDTQASTVAGVHFQRRDFRAKAPRPLDTSEYPRGRDGWPPNVHDAGERQ